MSLKKLYQDLIKENYDFKENINYYKNNLEIKSDDNLERILIQSSKDFSTKIKYSGNNQKEMLKTLNEINLPNKWPNNILEKSLYLFKGTLEVNNFNDEINLENYIISGKEESYKKPLSKIISNYKNKY